MKKIPEKIPERKEKHNLKSKVLEEKFIGVISTKSKLTNTKFSEVSGCLTSKNKKRKKKIIEKKETVTKLNRLDVILFY